MDWVDILRGQLADVFRWGLIVALVATTLRTQAVTGRWVPLGAGLLFVAAIIPLTMAREGGPALAPAVALGLLANLAILAVVLAIRLVWLRTRR